ncbi:hypothetical protein GOBAR_AA34184 [Gossypium barbadense]|uniref:Uncharacterized protein n=1 Tax=Gossypium barbadense TaxID=3634 RepID=A0A2P5W623_GOSBA|nr:hypothetical protein GOBAR_AA34184 [Gossypium barbadense]
MAYMFRFKDWPKPWYFWRKQGSEYFIIDGTTVDVVWDFKAGNFNGETEPQSDYYVALFAKMKAFYFWVIKRKMLIERLVAGHLSLNQLVCSSDGMDPVLEIRVDGKLAIEVKHLQ